MSTPPMVIITSTGMVRAKIIATLPRDVAAKRRAKAFAVRVPCVIQLPTPIAHPNGPARAERPAIDVAYRLPVKGSPKGQG